MEEIITADGREQTAETAYTQNSGAGRAALKGIKPEDIAVLLTKQQREKLAAGRDFKVLAKIFEDEEMMRTVDAFLENGMNVSLAARKLFMHRNTMTYRLNCIKKLTGLDLRNFDMAFTFRILHILYND